MAEIKDIGSKISNYGKRAIVIVLDGVGIGELPDALDYGDVGSNTLVNLSRSVGGLELPSLGELGLGNITLTEGVPPEKSPAGAYGKMLEVSLGKDTTTGHWEHMGIWLTRAFPVYPDGFPPAVINEFEKRIGRGTLGNIPASGTGIIDELGPEHIRTGSPIVYTSADSVFQIACHKDIIPLEELYDMCATAREILRGEHEVVRVIARPFVGQPGSFERTHERRDFSVEPPSDTVLDLAVASGLPVWAIGKISEIFAGRGISRSWHNESNDDGLDHLGVAMKELDQGIIYLNLVDFDTKYGHRNDTVNFAKALTAFDRRLPDVLASLRDDDLLIITADHGNDPTTPSTDHSREYVPILATGGKNIAPLLRGVDLGVRESFSDIGRTICEHLGIENTLPGTRSILP